MALNHAADWRPAPDLVEQIGWISHERLLLRILFSMAMARRVNLQRLWNDSQASSHTQIKGSVFLPDIRPYIARV
jgi:hypothetical protein